MVLSKRVLLVAFVVAFAFLLSGCAQVGPIPSPSPNQIANPASSYCEQSGGKLAIVTESDGSQVGICTLPSGLQCEEWAYFRGDCPALGALPPVTPAPAPAVPAGNASTAPSPSPAPPATGASISVWQQVISATVPSSVLSLCAQFSDPQSRDVCQWFAAGVTQDKSICAAFSDSKYLSFCTQELNGQSACTPSQCAHCTSQSSCAQFPTCNFDPSASLCAQWSTLANPNLSIQPPPPQVGGVG